METPQDFIAGWEIGNEISKTNDFLQGMVVKFFDMVVFIYKYMKRFVFEWVNKLWALYLSFFFLSFRLILKLFFLFSFFCL
jgi:hypothetical protein